MRCQSRPCDFAAGILDTPCLAFFSRPGIPSIFPAIWRLTAITTASDTQELELLARPGCYSLLIAFPRRRKLRIGKLGKAEFPAGIYVYTGSAMGGLRHRLGRHLKRRKKLRWHIDYLLCAPPARVKEILLYSPAPAQECRRNQFVAGLPGAQMVMRRFGASDCSARCATHLYLFPKNQTLRGIATALRQHCSVHLIIDEAPAREYEGS